MISIADTNPLLTRLRRRRILFLSLLLTSSRLPFALAAAGQMPAALARVHPRFGTPWAAVIASSVGYSICAFWSFKELIVLNIWLYSITLILELAAFVALRYRELALPRPWRVGGGSVGGWVTAGLPVALCALAMATNPRCNRSLRRDAAAIGKDRNILLVIHRDGNGLT